MTLAFISDVRLNAKGQGHAVIKCAAGVGVQVDMTAEVFLFIAPLCSLASCQRQRAGIQ